MNLKDKLLELKNIIIKEKNIQLLSTPKNKVKIEKKDNVYSSSPIDLNDKVDMFIDWYFKNMVKGKYTDIGEYNQPNVMRNLIEKMAVWYELRYPDYEINRLFPGSDQEQIFVDNIMFNDNKYINQLFDKDSDIRILEWDEFFNTDAFINSLSWEEKIKFDIPQYREIVYLDNGNRISHLHLTKKGIVEMSENISTYTNSVIKDEELEGLHIREVVELFKNRGIALPSDNELEQVIQCADKYMYQKEEMLNCVMYRIIERGGNRIGPRRAFLFAKEFERNIDIPMMYAVDLSDPGLRKFMNEYIKAGGSKNLLCYIGYFFRTNKKQKLKTVPIERLILILNNNAATFYTPEETELHQKLANALNYKLGQDISNQDETKRLKLKRK